METPVVRGRPRPGVYADKRPARLYLIEPVFDAVVAELTDELQRRAR